MPSYQGRVQEVAIIVTGAELDQDSAIGATVLYLSGIDDFDPENGGQISIAGQAPVSYLTVTETEDFSTDAEGAQNPPVCTITLAIAESSAHVTGDRVDLFPYSEAKRSQVLLAGNEDEPVEVTIPHELVGYLNDGIRTQGTEESVIVDTDGTGDLYISAILGDQPVFLGQYVDPEGLGNPIPTEPPSISPALDIRPHSLGFVIVAENIDPTSMIDYYIGLPGFSPGPTSLIPDSPTRSQVLDVRKLPDGTPFVAGVSYAFIAVATNVAGSAPPTLEVTAQLRLLKSGEVDEITISKITSGNLTAAIALLGSLQVGQITLSSSGGLNIPLSNGGLISLPADGSAAQFIRVLLQATALLVEGNFELRGGDTAANLNNLAGILTVGSGIIAPAVGPTVTTAWDDPSVKFVGGGTPFPKGSDLVDGGTVWVLVGSDSLVGINKTTGAVTNLLTDTAISPESVSKSGTNYYIYGYSNTTGLPIVRKYNSSFVYVAASQFSVTVPSGYYTYDSKMAIDGSTLYVVFYTGFNVKVISMTLTGTSQTTVFTDTSGVISQISSIWVGTADFGAQRFVFLGTINEIMVFSNTGVNVTSQSFVNPNGEYAQGINWDGSDFRVYTSTNTIWKQSRVVTALNRSARWSKYDNDATNGNHETAWSPATSFTHPPRQWMRISTPAPEDDGGIDDPDSIFHYIQTISINASYWRQAIVTASPWAAWYGIPLASGSSAVSSPSFSAVSKPGALLSAATLSRGLVVATKQITSNVATLTTQRPHRFGIGNSVVILGVDATFDGTYTIVATPSPTTFTYAKVSANTGPSAATGIATSLVPVVGISGDGSGEMGGYRWNSDGTPINDDLVFVAGSNGTTVATSSGTFLRHSALGVETLFTAPPSGCVMVEVAAYLTSIATLVLFCPEVRAGSTIGSGTVVYAATNADSVGLQNNTGSTRFKTFILVRGLTPGSVYNTYMAIYRTAAGEAVNNPNIRVTPVR